MSNGPQNRASMRSVVTGQADREEALGRRWRSEPPASYSNLDRRKEKLMEQQLVVWKYPVRNLSRFTLSVPVGACVLAVQKQRGQPQIWMLVDPEALCEEKVFRVIGTGHQYSASEMESWTYHGTFQTCEGDFVWHLFEMSSDGSPELEAAKTEGREQ